MPNTANPLGNRDSIIDTLLNIAQEKVKAETRTELHKMTGISASLASKLRNKRQPVGPETLLRFYDATGISIEQLREYFGLEPYSYINAKPSGDQQTAQNEGNN